VIGIVGPRQVGKTTLVKSILHIIELRDNCTIEHLWLKGGFPNAVLEDDDDISIQWMQSFISGILHHMLRVFDLNDLFGRELE